MLERIDKLTKRKLNAFRNNPLKEFVKFREEFKSNHSQNIRITKIENRERIQTRLGDKIVIF